MLSLITRTEQVTGPLGSILDYSCASEILEDGWKSYRIETHCVAWTVEARPLHDFTTMAPLWEVRRMVAEDC